MAERIGDQQRASSLDLLSKAYAEGYLTPVEFDERTTQVAEFKWKYEIERLFDDLPYKAPWKDKVSLTTKGLQLAQYDLEDIREASQAMCFILSITSVIGVVTVAGIAGNTALIWAVLAGAVWMATLALILGGFGIYTAIKLQRLDNEVKNIRRQIDYDY